MANRAHPSSRFKSEVRPELSRNARAVTAKDATAIEPKIASRGHVRTSRYRSLESSRCRD